MIDFVVRITEDTVLFSIQCLVIFDFKYDDDDDDNNDDKDDYMIYNSFYVLFYVMEAK